MLTQNFPSKARNVGNVYRRLIWGTSLAMLVTTVANLGLYAAGGTLFPEVTAWPGASAGQIIGANVIYLLMAAVIFAVIIRFSLRPVRTYLVVATIGLLLSLVMPISAGFGYGPPNTPPADTATVIMLSLMHLLSFVISVPLFIRLALD